MLGNTIASYRKKLGLTQEQLAQSLEVTNQAVSKWETDQCCPDTMLLPKLADVFGITVDALFGRESAPAASGLPWENDGALHMVLYEGHKMLLSAPDGCELSFEISGPAKDVYCAVNLTCDDVQGNVEAKGYVECDSIGGDLNAGGYVECDDVGGKVNAGSYVECGDVEGGVNSSSYVECGDVGGSVNAMSYVECGDVGCSVTSGAYVECGRIGGGDESDKDEGGSGFHFGFNPFKK